MSMLVRVVVCVTMQVTLQDLFMITKVALETKHLSSAW